MLRKLPTFILLAVLCPLAGVNIGRISFKGVDAPEIPKLQKACGLGINQPYKPEDTAAAINGLYSYFQAQGRYYVYIPAPELIPLDEQSMEICFNIREISSSEQVTIHLSGMQYFSEAKLRQMLLLPADKQLRLQQMPGIMQQILTLYNSRSYLFAKVQIDSLMLVDGLTAYVGITEGKPLRVKEYIFRGNKSTRDKTLLNLSGLSRVKSITPEVLTQAEENIRRKSYIRDCVIEPIDENSLLIRIEENRMTLMEGVFGMSSKEEKLQFSGQIRLQFLNLWGSDRGINLWWKQVPKLKKELSLSYHESGIEGIPVEADMKLMRNEQDSTWVQSHASLEVYYRMLNQKLGMQLVGESISPGARRPATIKKSNANSIGAFWDYTKVEGGYNPVRGVQLNLLYRYKNGADNKLHAATEAGTKWYLPLGKRFVAHAGLQVRNLDNEQATAWEQYKMGGYGNLRGYHEDEFSSFRLGWTNYELRYRLNPDSRVYMFFDQGYLGKADNRLKADIFGLGGGIKLKTRLGIMGLEYGLGYRDKRFSRIGLGMVHAGLDIAL